MFETLYESICLLYKSIFLDYESEGAGKFRRKVNFASRSYPDPSGIGRDERRAFFLAESVRTVRYHKVGLAIWPGMSAAGQCSISES